MNKRFFVAADWIAFVVVPIVLGLLSISSGGDHMYKERGGFSLNVLYVILFMKPIIVILGYRDLQKLLPYRRQLGMLAFWFGLFHTGGLILTKNLLSISDWLSNPWSNYLFYGGVAMVGMLILAVTSNFYSMKKLGSRWKMVQWLAYPVLFLSKLHADLSKRFGTRMNFSQNGSSELSQPLQNPTSSIATNTVSYQRFIPTLILLVLFLALKYRQHKVQTKQWKSIAEYMQPTQ